VRLSYLADTLKTGSLSVGAIRVAASSEKLVHYGNCIDTDVSEPLTEPAALRKIEAGFVQVKKDYGEAEMWLKKYFEGSQDAERESSSETITKSSVTPIIL
jgi:osomolarity two-component system phosphorelay intermediate protein YPD1